MTKITTTDLDVASIKASLRTYLENSGKFNDYDFEGSNLSVILDVLAYNTHMNALNANFGLNESFLDSAQLRGSLVSQAKPLNYLPKSKTGPNATVDITLLSVPGGTSDISIPRYTKLVTSIDGTSYSYYTLDEYTATSASGYKVTGAVIYEGVKKTKKFFVDAADDQYPIYVIPDTNFDTASATVALFEGYGSTTSKTLTRPVSVDNLNSTSDIYLLHEAPNGYYEIMLGDGVMGARPSEGSILQIDYLSTNGPDSNGASIFSLSGNVSGYAASINTTIKAAGGSDKESIESIRFNAPLAFASQNRAVTVSDFKAHIQNYATYIETMNVWGGEDNEPKEYGRVFIAIKPVGSETITSAQETQIRTNVLDDKAIVTVEFTFVDPTYEYLEIQTNYRYNPAKTTYSKQQFDIVVKNTIIQYGTDNLTSFDTVFRKSNLTTAIDASNVAIASSSATVKLQKRFVPVLGARDAYNVDFTRAIAAVSTQTRIVTSNPFTYNVAGVDYSCRLRNISGSSTLEIYRISSGTEVIVVDDAGYIDYVNNRVVINPFQPTAFEVGKGYVAITVVPADDSSVTPLRNMLVRIDDNAVASNGIEDTTA